MKLAESQRNTVPEEDSNIEAVWPSERDSNPQPLSRAYPRNAPSTKAFCLLNYHSLFQHFDLATSYFPCFAEYHRPTLCDMRIDRGNYLLSPVLQSIIGATKLDFRVRNGTGYILRAKSPLSMSTSSSKMRVNFRVRNGTPADISPDRKAGMSRGARKSEYRNPKPETNSNVQNSNFRNRCICILFWISNFGHSCLFRISYLKFRTFLRFAQVKRCDHRATLNNIMLR